VVFSESELTVCYYHLVINAEIALFVMFVKNFLILFIILVYSVI